ncbi:beta-lactamase/transpeptidase-like protein [Calocera cornea HHB12733]|uniref:Beta-lactamase/transpeptidase-like protein n=1 Tax=Calocera cornea HHB12733 TaxID=1353952 RepID=A0A165EYN1_9BASI|nr:beta-lactamase/transpeptidase-like protein [Calocera cornea HHB12733]
MLLLLTILLLPLTQATCEWANQVPLLSDNYPTAISPDFMKYVEKVGKLFDVPGLSLGVVRKGHEAQFFNWGQRDEDGNSPTECTMYPMASASKNFASTSFGILMDDFKHGRNVTPLPYGVELDWETKLVDLLQDEWGLKDPYTSGHVKVIDLLSHVTGLPRHEFSYDLDTPLPHLVSQLQYLRPTHELRETFEYINLMYSVITRVIGKYSNMSYTSFVESRIFTRLGMTSTTFHPERAWQSRDWVQLWVREAGPYYNQTRVVPWYLEERAVDGPVSGPGGVVSNTKDMATYLGILLNGGIHPDTGEQLIPRAVLDSVMLGRVVEEGRASYPELAPTLYGAGWQSTGYQGHEIVQHGGGARGISTALLFLPNDGVGVVALCNGNNQHPALFALVFRIIEESLGLKRIDWISRCAGSLGYETREPNICQVEGSTLGVTVRASTVYPAATFTAATILGTGATLGTTRFHREYGAFIKSFRHLCQPRL